MLGHFQEWLTTTKRISSASNTGIFENHDIVNVAPVACRHFPTQQSSDFKWSMLSTLGSTSKPVPSTPLSRSFPRPVLTAHLTSMGSANFDPIQTASAAGDPSFGLHEAASSALFSSFQRQPVEVAELSQFTIERSAGVSGGSLPVAALEHGLFDTAPEQMSSESDSEMSFVHAASEYRPKFFAKSPTETSALVTFRYFEPVAATVGGQGQEQKQQQLPAIYYFGA